MMWRGITLMFCALFAAFAIFSGVDRAAGTSAPLARFVPAPFAAQSLLATAGDLLDAERFAEANAAARRAIDAAPVEPDAPALLGTSRLALDDPLGAEAAFVVAAQFGWRTLTTQYYWMQRALDVGDFRVASQWLDAMLRQDPGLAENRELLEPFEGAPLGRAALVGRLMERPDWLRNYALLASVRSREDALRRADVFNRLAQRGHPLGCAAIGPLATKLVRLNSPALAQQTWRANCPSHSTGLIADTSFDTLQAHEANSPFEWMVLGDSDVSLSLETPPNEANRRLVLASSASFPRKALSQLVIVKPGTYRLSWRAVNSGGEPSNRISATMSCGADSHDWLAARFDPRSKLWVADVAIDGSCGASWLEFAIQPGKDGIALDRIALQPLR